MSQELKRGKGNPLPKFFNLIFPMQLSFTLTAHLTWTIYKEPIDKERNTFKGNNEKLQ